MFELGLLIGIYSNAILFLGFSHFLFKDVINVLSIVFFLLGGLILLKNKAIISLSTWTDYLKLNKYVLLLVILLFLQVFVNLIGVLGPELGFDALWYHLTLPKISLINHAVSHIQGGLLYYSDMPKLIEMMYVGGLSIGNEITAKFIHFLFGLLICISLYKFSTMFVKKNIAVIIAAIFYANLVVGWESISAYIDLGRTFFELISIWSFFLWDKTNARKYFFLSAFFLGFAIDTKILSLGTLFLIWFGILYLKKKDKCIKKIKECIVYGAIAILVPLPWFIFSFINAGNPIYPFFSHIYSVGFSWSLISPINFFHEVFLLFLASPDPLSPIYVILFPLVFFNLKKFGKYEKLLFFWGLGSILLWYITPRTGGGRFILPYLPLLSLLCGIVIDKYKSPDMQRFFSAIVFFLLVVSIGYRSLANAKFVPVILGKETKADFLAKHLNFSYGDFYDTDNYFTRHIPKNENVLLFGFHNLYYIDFPFIDSSWVKKGDKFSYIATQNVELPKRFSKWTKIYNNKVTHVDLYSNNSKQESY